MGQKSLYMGIYLKFIKEKRTSKVNEAKLN